MRVVRLFVVVAALLAGVSRSFAAEPTSKPTSKPTSGPTSLPPTCGRWGVYEASFAGPSAGNPFVDVDFSAQFTSTTDAKTFSARGFYDGEGDYRVRFMPPTTGHWRFVTRSNRKELNEQHGGFDVVAPVAGNHGPVRVANTFHFAYADGEPYFQIGTTCYSWVHQPEALEEQTLATLKKSPFNKLRMCVFPTAYTAGKNDPAWFPYVRGADGKFDYTRFDAAYFSHLEQQVARLGDMGIEADLILFHPYDKGQMGFDRMGQAADDLYLRYIVARLAAYHNVWWSLANEFDLMREKTVDDFDRFFQIVHREDPSDHLRSIHNSGPYYDQGKPWITHVSSQNGIALDDFGRACLYRDVTNKPVVYDENRYEGDIDRRWGQLTGEEMTMHFWMATIAGTYAGHGEAFKGEQGSNWTGRGGTLRGQSPPRIAFLKSILADAPRGGIEPIDRYFETHIGGKPAEYYLIYFGKERPTEWPIVLPRQELKDGMQFAIDVLDTWDMTITPAGGGPFKAVKKAYYTFGAEGDRKVALPGKPWMALRIRRVDQATTKAAPVNEAE